MVFICYWRKITVPIYYHIEIEDEERWSKSADTAINRKWWDYMADNMETNPDNSPVSKDMKLVFHLNWTVRKMKRTA